MDAVSTSEYEVGSARAYAFGKPHNFKPLVREWQNEEHFHETARIANSLGLTKLAVPQVYTFNARVATTDDFSTRYHIDGVEIATGLLADAIILKSGEAAGIVTGDCPTIIVHNEKTGEVAAAHGGRDSNIDRQRIDTSFPSRNHDGVLASILSYTSWKPSDLHLFICAGIGPEHFTHPWNDLAHGEANRAMAKWILEQYGEACFLRDPSEGKLNLPILIRAQALLLGIEDAHIQNDSVDTYSDERFWSHRNKNKSDGRNLVIVTNRAA